MATPRKKSIAGLAMLLGPMSKKARKPSPLQSIEGGEDSEGHPLDDAMSEFLAAIRDDDPQAMGEAFRSAVQLADDDGPPEGEGDEDEEM